MPKSSLTNQLIPNIFLQNSKKTQNKFNAEAYHCNDKSNEGKTQSAMSIYYKKLNQSKEVIFLECSIRNWYFSWDLKDEQEIRRKRWGWRVGRDSQGSTKYKGSEVARNIIDLRIWKIEKKKT